MEREKPRRRSSIHGKEYQALLRLLRAARLEAGLTQVEVAQRLGRPQSFVSKTELGERRLDPIDLRAFAAVYGKAVSFFLRG